IVELTADAVPPGSALSRASPSLCRQARVVESVNHVDGLKCQPCRRAGPTLHPALTDGVERCSSRALFRALKVIFQSQLNVAPPLRRVDHAEVGADRAGRGVQNWRVRHIDELATHLQALAFGEIEKLEDAQVDGIQPGSPYCSDTAIAEARCRLRIRSWAE